jgi:hypothetical protein
MYITSAGLITSGLIVSIKKGNFEEIFFSLSFGELSQLVYSSFSFCSD